MGSNLFRVAWRHLETPVKLTLTIGLAIGLTASIPDAYAGRKSRKTRTETSKAEPLPSGPLFAVISLGKQNLALYGADGLVARSPVSTGRKGYSTPAGIFSILEKKRHHRSNIYHGAPMPFMQRLTWSGVALHAGALPGYPASHGCIRLPSSFAKRLFDGSRPGQKILITRQEVTPVEFSHPRLPAPKLFPAPESETAALAPSQISKTVAATTPEVKTVSGGALSAEKTETAVKVETAPESQAPKLLNPVEFARIMKVQAAAKAKQANLAVEAAREAVSDKAEEARDAAAEVRKAAAALENAQDRIEGLERKAKRLKNEEAVQEVTSARTAAEALVKEIQARMAAAEALKAEKAEKAAQAAKAVQDAEEAKKTAANDIRAWNRRLEPVSIFISRKTSRLYVRQGLTKVFDAAVTIKEPETALGTHFYMATQADANGTRLQWLSLSIPEAQADEKRERKTKKKKADQDDAPAAVPVVPATAAQALDRIEVPDETASQLSELLWTGASLIVSDNAISNETNDFTDFVILTR